MAFKSYGTYEEDQLPDGTTDPQGQTTPMQEIGATSPAPYQPNQPAQRPELQSETGGFGGQPVPVRTFEQMQQEGLARPPMPQSPAPQMANMSLAPSGPPPQSGQVGGSQAPAAPVKGPNDYTPEEWGRMSVAEKNAVSEAFNRQQAGQDVTTNITSQPNANWTPDAIAAKRAEMMAAAGFGADGSYTPETEAAPYVNASMPNTTYGFPSSYDPSKPVQPNNGYVDAQGNYQTPNQPPKYIINGQYYDNPQGTGTPLGPANTNPATGKPQGPGAPSTTGGGGGAVTGGGASGGGATGGGGAGGPGSSSSFDILNALTQGASGGGPGSQVQNATQQGILNFLQNPNPYGAQDVKDQYSYLGGQIDDQYNQNNQDIGELMARRGLGYSTMYGGKLQDSNLARRSAKEGLATDLAHNYAQNYGQSQRDALGLGNQIGTQEQNNSQSWLSQLMGYGQQGFNNDLATNALNQGAQNSYQDFILRMLGLGYGGAT